MESRVEGYLHEFDTLDSRLVANLACAIGDHRRERNLLQSAIVDNPPMVIRDGGVIADGYDDEASVYLKKAAARFAEAEALLTRAAQGPV